jgi:hypothetical protein
MMRTIAVRISALAIALWPLAAVAATPAVGQNVQGVITNVDLHGEPRHITVQTPDGQQTDVVVHVSTTKLSFQDANVSPELSNLKAGEQVRAQYNGDQPSTRIDVLSVPANQQASLILRNTANADPRVAQQGAGAPAAAANNRLMVRLLKTNNASKGTVRADVAGRPRDFRLDNPKVLASFREGDLVVVTVDNPNAAVPTIEDMQPSSAANSPAK